MGIIVGEGAEAIEFFLAGCVPEGELDMDVVDEDVWRYQLALLSESNWLGKEKKEGHARTSLPCT